VDVRIAIPDRNVTAPVLDAGLEAVTRLNEALIAEGHAPTFSQAVKNGLQWKPEPPGAERFDHAMKTTARGWGDCDDLAPHRAAELRVTGIDPAARARVYKSGPGRWHAIVERGNGTLEDPSRTAGMRVREGSRAAGIAPAVVGAMGCASVGGAVRPFVAVRRDNAGYLARVDVPIEGDASLSCVQHGRSPSHALSGCMAGACMVGSASGMVPDDALDKMWALHGLMKGGSLADVTKVCGAEAAKDALLTLKEIAPDLIEELRKHWNDARVLREDLDRRAKRPGAPAVVGGRVHKRGAHNAAATLEHWKKQRMHGANEFKSAEPDWSERLAHDRVLSPYAERFGHRGRQFVGAATLSPYLELAAQRRTWGVPRAFVSEQAVSGANEFGTGTPDWAERLSHDRVTSPYAERYAHRGRQFVGAVGFTPHLSFSLAGEHPGYTHPDRGQGVQRGRAARIVSEADLADAVDRALRAPEIIGWDLFKDVVDPAIHTVENVVKDVAPIAGIVLSAAQGVISLVPGIGTGISAAISAGMAVLSGGSALDIAVKTAYGAIPIPPGIRQATDIVVNAALALAQNTKSIADAGIALARKVAVNALPAFAQGIGGTVFDTLAHLVLGATHKVATHAVVAPSPAKGFPPKVAAISKPAHYAVLAQVAARQAADAKIYAAAGATARARTAASSAAAGRAAAHRIHLRAAAPTPAVVMPVAAMAPSMPPMAPIARLSLATIIRTMQPEIIRHHVALPHGVRS